MFEHDPIDAGLEFTFDLAHEPRVTPYVSLVDSADDREWTREEWLDWYEHEFAGYAPDDDPKSLVEDDAGEDREEGDEPIRVSAWQLAQDRSDLRDLRRSWINTYRYSADGSRSIKGEHPFSVDEGASEWLQRTRLELRDAWISAWKRGDDRAMSALQAREAALRARHNARCWVRSCARYFGVDEKLALSLADLYQKLAPIGWVGIEAEARELFAQAEEHSFDARRAWDAEFDPSWEQAEKDAWLDRMPAPPEHPTQLVTSSKSLRKWAQVPRETTGDGAATLTEAERATQLRNAKAALLVKLAGLRAAPRVSIGNIRFLTRDVETEWYATRKEWELSEGIVAERLTVPESHPLNWIHGDLAA